MQLGFVFLNKNFLHGCSGQASSTHRVNSWLALNLCFRWGASIAGRRSAEEKKPEDLYRQELEELLLAACKCNMYLVLLSLQDNEWSREGHKYIFQDPVQVRTGPSSSVFRPEWHSWFQCVSTGLLLSLVTKLIQIFPSPGYMLQSMESRGKNSLFPLCDATGGVYTGQYHSDPPLNYCESG